MLTVDGSRAYCKRLARARARNFSYAFLLLPREERDAMCAIYAFMRKADDFSDEADQPPEARLEWLGEWTAALGRALAGRYGDDPILPAFHDAVRRYEIPREYFEDLIAGVTSDLSVTRYQTFDDLYRYCYRVASVVGMATVRVFGYESEECLELAEKCGIAFQLTNILRDIREDAALGRVYLPQEDLARFELTDEDLTAGRHDERFRLLMEFESRRADDYYRQAAPLLRMVRPRCRAALWAMMAIYHGILGRIREADYDVFTRRAGLSGVEKSAIVLRAFKLRYLGGVPPFPAS